LALQIFEQAGKMIAEPRANRALGQYKEFEGYISSEAVLKIDSIMRDLRSASRKPDKEKETKEVLAVANKGNLGKKLKKRVDLFVEMKNGTEYYFEVKTAKPNINEFTGIKNKCLIGLQCAGVKSQKRTSNYRCHSIQSLRTEAIRTLDIAGII